MEHFNNSLASINRSLKGRKTILSLVTLIAITLITTPLLAQGSSLGSSNPGAGVDNGGTTEVVTEQVIVQPAPSTNNIVVSEPTAPPVTASQPVAVPVAAAAPVVVEKVDVDEEVVREEPVVKPSEPAEKKWYDYIQISPDLILRTVVPFGDPGGRKIWSDIFKLGLKANMDFGNLKVITEIDATQQKGRGFYPSNVILRTAFVKWLSPVKGLSLSGGLLFNQFGFFWDDSFYGNSTVYMGKKLDTDMNLELAYNGQFGDHFALDTWLQVGLAGIDGVNPSIPFPTRDKYLKTAHDFEADSLYKEGLAARFRILPHLMFGKLKISPGFSLEMMGGVRLPDMVRGKSILDNLPPWRAKRPGNNKGKHPKPVVGPVISTATELTLELGPFKLIGEFETQNISEKLNEANDKEAISRKYLSVAAVAPIFRRADATWLRGMKVTGGTGVGLFTTEGFKEYIYNFGALFDIHQHLKAQVEYAHYWNDKEGYSKPYINEIVFLLVAKY